MKYLAVMDGDQVSTVQVASQEWIETFLASSPEGTFRTGDMDDPDRPSSGWSWSTELDRFIPPVPDPSNPSDYEYDSDNYYWIYIGPPRDLPQ